MDNSLIIYVLLLTIKTILKMENNNNKSKVSLVFVAFY